MSQDIQTLLKYAELAQASYPKDDFTIKQEKVLETINIKEVV